MNTTCHHDDLVLDKDDIEYFYALLDTPVIFPPEMTIDERRIRLGESFKKWVECVRSQKEHPHSYYNETWKPSLADIIKSRLFWRIRSGKEPLEFAPPCAYSCPWYEVVEEEGWHGAYECRIVPEDTTSKIVKYGDALIAQSIYEIVEKTSDNEYIMKYGKHYVFHVKRDWDKYCKQLATWNPHQPNIYDEYMSKENDRNYDGWFLMRLPEREN